jgi:predicted Co/Zn/Cd cation transporter (cation efflux family)
LVHEKELLAKVSPDDPISQFIDFFSDAHLLIFLAFGVIVVAIYGVRFLLKRCSKIVHFNDIPSFYPTTLCLLIASSAVLYSSIQLFGPETWRHFYYHPSLNPFALPFWLGVFITSVWAIIIVAIATVDDVTRMLPLGQAVLYLIGLAAVCAVCYVVFSITTLYYIGYPLLIAYYIFALGRQRNIP